MSFCRNCGKQLQDTTAFCPYCGCAQNAAPQQPPVPAPQQQTVTDSGSIGWGVLGFFIPLAGLVLYIVWMHEKPKCARAAGIGALIGVAAGILTAIITFITAMGAVGSFIGRI